MRCSHGACSQKRMWRSSQAAILPATHTEQTRGRIESAWRWLRRERNAPKPSTGSWPLRVGCKPSNRLRNALSRSLTPCRTAISRIRCGSRIPPMASHIESPQPAPGGLKAYSRGLRASWTTTLLVIAINTGVAGFLSIEDARPFWHPLITCQTIGLLIAYAVNTAQPWRRSHPVWRLAGAVAIGSVVGVILVVLIKGYVIGEESYRLAEMHA